MVKISMHCVAHIEFCLTVNLMCNIPMRGEEEGKTKTELDVHVAKAMSTFLCLHGEGTFIDTVGVALIIITVIIADRIIKLREYR